MTRELITDERVVARGDGVDDRQTVVACLSRFYQDKYENRREEGVSYEHHDYNYSVNVSDNFLNITFSYYKVTPPPFAPAKRDVLIEMDLTGEDYATVEARLTAYYNEG